MTPPMMSLNKWKASSGRAGIENYSADVDDKQQVVSF
jgi:hypothetical protein